VRKITLGKTGMRLSAVGLGTWMIERDAKASLAALVAAIESGADHIDTAEAYGPRTHELVAEAIRGRRDRVRLFFRAEGAGRQETLSGCEATLKRLGTDRIDCLLIHRKPDVPMESTLEAAEALLAQGKILSFGGEHLNRWDIEEIVKLAGPGRLACNQVIYSLRDRGAERDMLPLCREHRVAVIAAAPLAGGALARDRALGRLCRAGQTPAQLALAFLLARPGVLALTRSMDRAHMEETLRAGSIRLSAAQLSEIDERFPLKKN